MTSDVVVLRRATVLTMDGAAASDAAAREIGGGAPRDAAGSRATAVAVGGGRILGVGSDDEVERLAGAGATIIDMGGLAVLPGFLDAHAHPLWEGIVAGWPTLPAGPDVRAAMRALSGHAAGLPPDDWLLARYDQTGWQERRHPTRHELDRAVPDRPAVLNHVSGHAVAVNSLGLAMAGITGAAADRNDAVVDRDAHGEPTGLVMGPGAWARLAEAMPRPRTETLVGAIARAGAILVADGVTSVADADVGAVLDIETELDAWGAAVAGGRFPPRLALMPSLVRLAPEAGHDPPSPSAVREALPVSTRGSIHLDRAKLFADGALTTRTAWLAEPYADQAGWAGQPGQPPAELAERVRRASRLGWSVATHAIGDAAIRATVEAYLAAGPTSPDGRRHRIDHAMLMPHDLLEVIAGAAIPLALQPEFVAWAGDTYRERLGDERAGRLNRYASLLARGVPIAFSSDRPIVGGAPLAGIRAALRHAGPSGVPLAPSERPSVPEACRAWTAGAAALMDDPEGGAIIAGRHADLVVLSRDPTSVEAEAWAAGQDSVSVVATIVGGRLVAGDLPGLRDGAALAGPAGARA